MISIVVLLSISTMTVSAEESELIYDFSDLYSSISDDAKRSLENIGTESIDANSLSQISFDSIINEIINISSENISSPLKGLITITALLLLSSIISSYKNSLSNDITTAINIITALCVTSAVVLPTVSVIKSAEDVISSASNIMLAYVPVMTAIMSFSGNAVSSASYHSMMIVAGEGIGQLSSKVIVPLLNMFLGISVTSSVAPNVNLTGFTSMISKTVKWVLSFAMAIFTALLSLKQIITTSLDDVSSKAVRFTLSSFIPVVGSALSDAYKTVQGSVSLLKSGVGVFVIIAIAVVFLPVVIQCIIWILTLWLSKSTAEVLNLSQTAKLLENVSIVFSTLLAILLCIMSVYIISTTIVLLIGGKV